MDKIEKQKFWMRIGVVVVFFIISVSIIERAVLVEKVSENNTLKVVVLDVGQGDAIYIEAPNGNQVLFDAGKGSLILEKLKEVMPVGDKTINVIFATNPDSDHIGGIDEVLDEYEVGAVFEPGTISTTKTYQTFKKAVSEENAKFLLARSGTSLVLDEEHGVVIKILFPDQDVKKWTRNDGSIVARLDYRESSFLLMGDATTVTENYLIKKYGEIIDIDVLKIGHHGSHTSTSARFLEFTSPEYSVVSYGMGNSYGHPRQDVLDRVKKSQSELFGTGLLGNITFVGDGQDISVSSEF